MTVSITTSLNNARLAGVLSFLDSGPDNARFRLYGGTRRATPNDTPSSDMLCQITLTKPCGVVVGGALTLTPQTTVVELVNVSGVVTWATLVNGNDDTAADFDCSVTGGGGDVQLADVQVYAGGRVDLTSAVMG